MITNLCKEEVSSVLPFRNSSQYMTTDHEGKIMSFNNSDTGKVVFDAKCKIFAAVMTVDNQAIYMSLE